MTPVHNITGYPRCILLIHVSDLPMAQKPRLTRQPGSKSLLKTSQPSVRDIQAQLGYIQYHIERAQGDSYFQMVEEFMSENPSLLTSRDKAKHD